MPVPAPARRRYTSAAIDFAVCYAIAFAASSVAEAWARDTYHAAQPPYGLDDIRVFSFGFGLLCANAYLAISAAAGRSFGKALTDLRLVAGSGYDQPGLARGLVRSSLQAFAPFGLLLTLSGAHDVLASTRIVVAEHPDSTPDEPDEDGPAEESPGEDIPPIALWKVAGAVVVHLISVLLMTVLLAI